VAPVATPRETRRARAVLRVRLGRTGHLEGGKDPPFCSVIRILTLREIADRRSQTVVYGTA